MMANLMELLNRDSWAEIAVLISFRHTLMQSLSGASRELVPSGYSSLVATAQDKGIK